MRIVRRSCINAHWLTITVASPRIFHHAVCLVSWVSFVSVAWGDCARILSDVCRSIIGSGLGGTLSDPVKHYPSVFQPGSIFERFPYLLPNLVCTAVVCMGLVVGILFLEETHEEKKFRRDPGLELGGWILRKLCRTASSEKEYEKIGYFEETLSFLVEDNEILQGYAQPEALPHDGSTEAAPLLPPAKNELRHTEPAAKLPISRVFTKQIILNIVAYGILAL